MPRRILLVLLAVISLGLLGCPTDNSGTLVGNWIYTDFIYNSYHAPALSGSVEFRADGTWSRTGNVAFPSEQGPSMSLDGAGTWSVAGSTLTLDAGLSGIKEWEIGFSSKGTVASLTGSFGIFPVVQVLGRP